MRLVIIGQGYVGLPLAHVTCAAGMKVVGFDSQQTVVDNLNAGVSHIDDLTDVELGAMRAQGYRASSRPEDIADADVVVICVPTPLGNEGQPDLGAIQSAAETISRHMTSGTLVVLESTTYPGTTEELVLPILKATGLELDTGFHLAFSPERIDPGNERFGLHNTPKIVGGVTPRSTEVARAFYALFVDRVVTTKGAKEAEMAKLLENTYRHVNIALINEMARFCHDLGIDIWDVIDAASTKPFGFQAFYPGPGVGGHCIPIDPHYLNFEVQRKLGYPFRFVTLAEDINNSMPAYVVTRVQDALNEVGVALSSAKVLLLGVTYKADVADRRESPAVPIAALLREKGASVSFHDPRVPRWQVDGDTLESVTDLTRATADADIVVLLQAHSEYAVDDLADRSRMFLDTRGVTHVASAERL
jgi:nucleotide sugar dehydrogenase